MRKNDPQTPLGQFYRRLIQNDLRQKAVDREARECRLERARLFESIHTECPEWAPVLEEMEAHRRTPPTVIFSYNSIGKSNFFLDVATTLSQMCKPAEAFRDCPRQYVVYPRKKPPGGSRPPGRDEEGNSSKSS